MTLREYLEKNVGNRAKIGAQRGSSFIFCDEITDETIDTIQKMSDRQYKKITNTLQRLNDKNTELESFTDEADRLREWADRFEVSGDIREAIRIFISKYNQVKHTTKNQLSRANTVVRMWEPYLDRQIMEKYKAINEYKTMIVLVTGIENGAYWTIKEYRDSLKKGGMKNESAESGISDGSGADQGSDKSNDS